MNHVYVISNEKSTNHLHSGLNQKLIARDILYRYLFRIGFLLTCMVLVSGCSKKKGDKENFALDNSKITASNISSFTVDEENNLYVTGLFVSDNDSTEDYTYLNKYNIDGELVESKKYNMFGSLNTIVVKENIVYFLVQVFTGKKDVISLYQLDFNTDESFEIMNFPYIEKVKNMVLLGDELYILGGNEYIMHGGANYSGPHPSKDERLVSYNIKTKQVKEVGLDIPINISASENNKLLVYCYMKEQGYVMVEYDPVSDNGTILATMDGHYFNEFTMGKDKEHIIYSDVRSMRGLILSKLDSISTQAKLYVECSSNTRNLIYQNGMVYFMDLESNIVQLSIENMKIDNTPIKYLQSGYMAYEPYAGGYLMDKVDLEYEKLVLKILAQDPDYDMALLSSKNTNSYNLKKNGSFYPLNEVNRIEEYLDACFPYVKEAALDEDELVWMLPIAVDMPTYMINTEVISTDYTKGYDYTSFLELLHSIPTDEIYNHFYSWYTIEVSFLQQYIDKYHKVGDIEFKDIVELLPTYQGLVNHFNSSGTLLRNPDVEILDITVEENMLISQIGMEHWNNKMRAIGVPKLSSTDKNIGYVVYLVINPQSKQLNDMVHYIEDYISYTLDYGTTPMFFKNRAYEVDTLDESLYHLYEQGKIVHRIDEQLYTQYWDELIEGTVSYDTYVNEANRKLDMYYNE